MLQLRPPTDALGAHVAERLKHALAGRYELEGAIAQGGMGLVFRARDLHNPRRVAVKVLPPELGTAVAFERFAREIRTHAALHHPHILGFIESGDAGGLPFYVMPLVDGESLRDKLRREGRIPLPEAARIVREVASALAHAHAHGVVHRDVKPENVLLVDGRHVLVADFGLAHAVFRAAAEEKLTRSAHILGTAAYMSPEQGSGGDVDGRADVYSLGCMLFEMLAGHPPFSGENPMAVLAQHMASSPPRVSDGTVTVPPAVEQVVHRALEKDPAHRWPTATALSEALDAAIVTSDGRRARPAVVTAVVAVVVVALALTATVVAVNVRDTTASGVEPRAAPETAGAARQAYDRGRRALERWNLAAADSAFSRALAADANFAAAHLALAQARSWRSDDVAGWHRPVERAVALAHQLTPRDRALAAALLDMAHGRYPEACARYERLKRESPDDFAATFGIGECIRRDSIVVVDARSPSGFRFRASRWRAIQAYHEAFELHPASHRAFQERGFEQIRDIFLTATSARVGGRAVRPDSTRFRAAPAWDDSLLLVPWPSEVEQRDPGRVVSLSAEEAVDRTRRIFRRLAASWREAFPDEVLPREAVAIALELMGDPTALDTLLEARRLATDPEQRVRLAAQEVWMRVKFALPDDTAGLSAARTLADSLLDAAGSPLPGATETLAGLALLTGRPHTAASLARHAARSQASAGLPVLAVSAARALLAYAAAGAPAESLDVLEARVDGHVRANVAPREQRQVLAQLLGQAAGIAFTVQPLRAHQRLAGPANPLLAAQWALRSGDRTGARRILAERTRMRSFRRPADLALDVSFAGAWTLRALGDRARAVEWLDPVLEASRYYPQDAVSRPANAGTLVRALALRAELAAAAGDTSEARRWARAVLVLWRNADPALHPVTQPMTALVSLPSTTVR